MNEQHKQWLLDIIDRYGNCIVQLTDVNWDSYAYLCPYHEDELKNKIEKGGGDIRLIYITLPSTDASRCIQLHTSGVHALEYILNGVTKIG